MKVQIRITETYDAPDGWEIVDHPDLPRVLKVGNKFCDFGIQCYTTTDNEEQATWAYDEDLYNQILSYIPMSQVEVTLLDE